MIGRTISHYRIVEKIGEGGMGEVYLAEDTSLPRKVALKFLPTPSPTMNWPTSASCGKPARPPLWITPSSATSSKSPRPMTAPTSSSWNMSKARPSRHVSNEGPLSAEGDPEAGHRTGRSSGVGPCQRDHPPGSEALEHHAHTGRSCQGHGLRPGQAVDGGRSRHPGPQLSLDRNGAVLGTLPYMSPEHIRGQAVDHRSDIFSLGIVLYEALTGVHPFRKAQPGETAGAILKEEPPPLSRYVAEVPELLRHTIEKMLAKDPTERFQSVHEVLTNLNRLREDSGKVTMIQDERVLRMPTWAWLAAMVAVCAIVLIAWEFWLRPEGTNTSVPLMRSSIVLPEGERLASGSTYRHAVAISPDGRWVAYASYKPGDGDEPDGDPVINLRRLDQTEVRRIPGMNPFFSPDSRQLGFVERRLRRSSIEAHESRGWARRDGDGIRGPCPGGGYGCAWLPDGRIVFSPRENSCLFTVPACGGRAEPADSTGR